MKGEIKTKSEKIDDLELKLESINANIENVIKSELVNLNEIMVQNAVLAVTEVFNNKQNDIEKSFNEKLDELYLQIKDISQFLLPPKTTEALPSAHSCSKF